MSARDRVIDHLADNIEPGPARTLSVRAGAKRSLFPAGDVTVRELWESIVVQLEELHRAQALERLFDVLAKDYPRTIEECRALLDPPKGGAPAGREPKRTNRARRIRIYDGDTEVWWLCRSGDVGVTVWVGAKRRGEEPPLLVVASDADDELTVTEPELDAKKEWWLYDVTIVRAGLSRRDVQFRVADTPKTKHSLTLVSPALWYPAVAAFCAGSLLCVAVFLATFRNIPGASWSAIASAIPALPVLLGAVSLTPSFATLRAKFLYPAGLAIVACMMFVLAWVPGLFLIAVENTGTSEIRLGGHTIKPESYIVVRPATLERDGGTLCKTAAERAFGLDAFLPRSQITGGATTWPVLGTGFDPSATRVVAGGLAVTNGEVIIPCQDRGARPHAEVTHGENTIFVPHRWALSPAGGGKLQLAPLAGGAHAVPRTRLLRSPAGELWCELSGAITLEPIFPSLPARELRVSSSAFGTQSEWRGAPMGWRCMIEATKTAVVIQPSGSQTTLDVVLPASLGVASVEVGSSRIDVGATQRYLYWRPVTAPVVVRAKQIALDGGGTVRIDAGHALAALPSEGFRDRTFTHEDKPYKLSISGDGHVAIVLDVMPSGPCTRLLGSGTTTHERPGPGLECETYPSGSDAKDAEDIASDERARNYRCTDVYVCKN